MSPEFLEISSGKLLLVDQFMLANEQFTTVLQAESGDLEAHVAKYSGALLSLPNGKYQVSRDPQAQILSLRFIAEDEEPGEDESLDFIFEEVGPETTRTANILIDTRCLVMSDLSLVMDKDSIGEYRSLTLKEEQKKARDFLRSKGAMVRYGFDRNGDDLGVYVKDEALVALWPN